MVDEMLDDYLSREDKGVEWLKDYAQFFNVDHKIWVNQLGVKLSGFNWAYEMWEKRENSWPILVISGKYGFQF